MPRGSAWRDVRRAMVSNGRLDDARVRALTERMATTERFHRLAEIRGALGITQSALAAQMEVSQARVSQIERGDLDRTEVATLRRYVRELGGEMEIVVRVGGERLPIA